MGSAEKTGKLRNTRAFELDLLRGFAIFMMILHHFAYDLRHVFEHNVFAFIDSDWFWAFLHPFFLQRLFRPLQLRHLFWMMLLQLCPLHLYNWCMY